jgi:hypothetical protein
MTTTDSTCDIWGAWNICPASTLFNFDGQEVNLEAELFCPLSSVAKSNFIDASQKGRCECHAELVALDDSKAPMDCNCFACPEGSRIGFAYDCLERIFGPCTQFNCAGECNGRFNFGLDSATEAPTAALVGGLGSGAMTTSTIPTFSIIAFTILWMIRR